MSQASGMSMEEMLNTFAADPTEGRAWMKFPVAHNADGDAYCDDGGGDVLLTRVNRMRHTRRSSRSTICPKRTMETMLVLLGHATKIATAECAIVSSMN